MGDYTDRNFVPRMLMSVSLCMKNYCWWFLYVSITVPTNLVTIGGIREMAFCDSRTSIMHVSFL